MRILSRVAAFGALACFGCSSPSSDAALRVLVDIDPDAQSLCVKVVVAGDGRTRESKPIPISGKATLTVGVKRDQLPAAVKIQAVGYSDLGCLTLMVPAELSQLAPATFGTDVPTVQLMLKAAGSTSDGGTGGTDGGGGLDGGDPGADAGQASDGGVDLDLDGFPLPADCNDSDPLVNPAATEVCSDSKDNNCDLATDCEDATCSNALCGTGVGARCIGMTCREQACGDAADNDKDTALDCLDSDCSGQPCGLDGGCVANLCVSGTEVGLCFDNQDNDNDGLKDCADVLDCSGTACNDGNLCTLNDLCSAGAACVGGAPKVCNAPPSTCFNTLGVCLIDGGSCAYSVKSGSCKDNLACTLNELCLADGGCAGVPKSCPAPASSCLGAGTCQEALDGGCSYPVLTGGCNDLNNCTVGDMCGSDGGCAGTMVGCVAPGECFNVSSMCLADGGCIFTPKTGMGCGGGGTCSVTGVCVPPAAFPYTPSNFTEAQLPALAGAMTFDCGVTVVDTQSADGGVAWSNNCAGNPTPAFAVIQVGGQPATVLYVNAISVPAGDALRVVGGRPLIVAVRTTLVVGGVISARSTKAGGAGAGADVDCISNRGGADGTGATQTAGGGGGGAFGANGANGSNGNNGGSSGNGGQSFGTASLVPLRGGCHGGNGGRPMGNFGLRGAGGGAVQFSVAGAFTLNAAGVITASGAGGRGGEYDQRTAGGGGGSGGAVLIEGVTVAINNGSFVTANGGGGAEGSGIGFGFDGLDGEDGYSASASRTTAQDSVVCGGGGGSGGARAGASTPGTAPSCANSSGGGGGGGIGRIRFNASTSCTIGGTSTVSPDHSGAGSGCP